MLQNFSNLSNFMHILNNNINNSQLKINNYDKFYINKTSFEKNSFESITKFGVFYETVRGRPLNLTVSITKDVIKLLLNKNNNNNYVFAVEECNFNCIQRVI
jgi:hypothetical protein